MSAGVWGAGGAVEGGPRVMPEGMSAGMARSRGTKLRGERGVDWGLERGCKKEAEGRGAPEGPLGGAFGARCSAGGLLRGRGCQGGGVRPGRGHGGCRRGSPVAL